MSWTKIIKLVLESCGIIISIISLLLMLFKGEYLLFGVLVIGTLVLLFFLYKSASSQPTTVTEIHFEYQFIDADGKEVMVTKKKVIRVMERNITTLHDDNITASGRITDLQSNLGSVVEAMDLGGAFSVKTSLPVPLDKGKSIEHVLKYKGINCFLKKDESVTFTAISRIKRFSVKLYFLKERHPTQYSAFLSYGNSRKNVTNELVSVDNLCYSLAATKPKIGSQYTFTWQW